MKALIAGLVVSSLPMLVLGAESAGPSPLVAPGEKVAGRTQADWSRVWWQWAWSFDDSESPVVDKKGDRCRLRQEGEVWFLAGTYGTQRTVRTCTVPAGKYLFFPLVNYVVYPQPGLSLSCEMATTKAARLMSEASALVLEVDGTIYKNLAPHRQQTRQCFDLAERGGGGLAPSAANGYYIMLRPLSRGTHTINFGGILPEMTQAVTYTLHVE
ncbi:MAG TPA: hypothetical protein VFV88_13680 [Steroidobacteraceae bacterium]|jgi:hypothetical protein|nr:hypothetical protein [Steroidobacteraceae bacterium]